MRKKAPAAGRRRIIRILGGVLAASAFLYFFSSGKILSTFTDSGSAEKRPGINDTGKRIQVSVLNGCNIPGIAMKMTEHLRSLGYDVVEIGDFGDGTLQRSMLIDWNGDTTAAARITQAIGIGPNRLVRKKGTKDLVDFSVVLGKDYAKLIP